MSRACHYHIRALRHIRSFLTHDSAVTIACGIVSSRLDYCNSLLYGSSAENIQQLQRAQNTLARVVTGSRSRTGSTPLLQGLHWLPVDYHSIQNLEPHLQDSTPAAANIPTTSTLQVHSITFFAIRRADATDHSMNQPQNRNQNLQSGSTNHLEQSSSKCQGRCHTRNISVTFEEFCKHLS